MQLAQTRAENIRLPKIVKIEPFLSKKFALSQIQK
jgi:hypothetical protein